MRESRGLTEDREREGERETVRKSAERLGKRGNGREKYSLIFHLQTDLEDVA